MLPSPNSNTQPCPDWARTLTIARNRGSPCGAPPPQPRGESPRRNARRTNSLPASKIPSNVRNIRRLALSLCRPPQAIRVIELWRMHACMRRKLAIPFPPAPDGPRVCAIPTLVLILACYFAHDVPPAVPPWRHGAESVRACKSTCQVCSCLRPKKE